LPAAAAATAVAVGGLLDIQEGVVSGIVFGILVDISVGISARGSMSSTARPLESSPARGLAS
jgi:hypothetical protein